MHTISLFFITLWRSATDLSFYRTFKKKFWSGFWYVYWISVLLLFISGVGFAVKAGGFLLKVDRTLLMTSQTLDQLYSAELKVSVISGALMTNVQTPYAVDVPQVTKDWLGMTGSVKHLVVIDPAASAEDYPSKNTIVLLTGKSVIFPDNNSRGGKDSGSSYRVASLKDVNKLEIDRASYDLAVTKIKSFFPFVKPGLVVAIVLAITILPFIGGFFAVAGTLFSLVISSFFLWILSLLLKVPGGYGRVYILSMYGLTGSAIYSMLESVFQFHVPLIYTVLFWVWMIVILVALRPRGKVGKQVTAVKAVKRKGRK